MREHSTHSLGPGSPKTASNSTATKGALGSMNMHSHLLPIAHWRSPGSASRMNDSSYALVTSGREGTCRSTPPNRLSSISW